MSDKPSTSEVNNTEQPEKTWADQTAKPSNRGGKGARKNRVDRRAEKNNPAKAKAITSQVENRLGLKSTEHLLAIKTGCTVRPTAVHVDLYGCNSAVVAMIDRMRNVAQRPLALLLADNAVAQRYRKVISYLLFSRICAAHQKMSYAAGTNLPLVAALTADQLRAIDAYMLNIPNFLAWMISNIGIFEYESSPVIPTLPNPAEADVTIQDAIRGNYNAMCFYVHRHRPTNGIIFPQADEALLPVLGRVWSIGLTGNAGNRRFNAATENLYHAAISPEEWNAFAAVNNALAEQKCTVHSLSLSEASGSEIARVRFNSYDELHTELQYYCTNAIDEVAVRSAIILRLGNDMNLPADSGTRFLGAYATAPLVGHGVPAPYVQAQLQMITKNESR